MSDWFINIFVTLNQPLPRMKGSVFNLPYRGNRSIFTVYGFGKLN